VRALAANRQAAAMTQAAIRGQIHQAFDVLRNFAAQIAFDHVVAIDRFADLQHFLIGQLADAAIFGNADLRRDFLSFGFTNAVNVLERDNDALLGRDVYTGDTGHELALLKRENIKRDNESKAPPILSKEPRGTLPVSRRGPVIAGRNAASTVKGWPQPA
jgi:hypothetical protein